MREESDNSVGDLDDEGGSRKNLQDPRESESNSRRFQSEERPFDERNKRERISNAHQTRRKLSDDRLTTKRYSR